MAGDKPGRKKYPENPRRYKQVSTFMKRYGRQGYQQAGSLGGKKSPTKFTSETASRAAKLGWEKRHKRAAEREKTDENTIQSED